MFDQTNRAAGSLDELMASSSDKRARLDLRASRDEQGRAKPRGGTPTKNGMNTIVAYGP